VPSEHLKWCQCLQRATGNGPKRSSNDPVRYMKRRRHQKKAEDRRDDLSPPELVCSLLRDIQWETNCSTLSLQRFLDSLRGRLGEAVRQCKASGLELPRSVKFADKKMKNTVTFIQILLEQSLFFMLNMYLHHLLGWRGSCLPARMCRSRM